MSARLFENDAVTGWVLTAALHSLAVGLVFWLVLALVRRNGPSESCWFGRAGTAALLMLPLTLLAVGHLNRESPPVPNPVPPAITEPIVERARLVIPFPDPDRPVESAAPVRRRSHWTSKYREPAPMPRGSSTGPGRSKSSPAREIG